MGKLELFMVVVVWFIAVVSLIVFIRRGVLNVKITSDNLEGRIRRISGEEGKSNTLPFVTLVVSIVGLIVYYL